MTAWSEEDYCLVHRTRKIYTGSQKDHFLIVHSLGDNSWSQVTQYLLSGRLLPDLMEAFPCSQNGYHLIPGSTLSDPREQSDPIETTHCQSPGRTLLDPKKTTVWNQRDHCLILEWSLPHPIVWTQVDQCLIPGRPLPDLTNIIELMETTAWSEGTTAWSQGDHCLIPEIPLSNPREITS
jgi:hypothetical protein